MKGITYTQVAQYCVLIFAFMVPAIFISILATGNPIPQLGFGDAGSDGVYLLDKLDGLMTELGFTAYTDGSKSKIDVFFITAALMLGTAGLPHVIIRFFTVPKVKDARKSAGYALLFIAILYTTAPAIAVFARTNLMETVQNTAYTDVPQWFTKWEDTGLISWTDKNGDGRIQYLPGTSIVGKKPEFTEARGSEGQRLIANPSQSANELYVDPDITVLANPEIANLPNWVIALVAAGGLAAALSTAAGLLLVISTSISHDLIKKQFIKDLSDKNELRIARLSALFAVVVAGYFGINPPGFVASVVALAFGLAASSFFPAIVMGIFSKRMNSQGAIAGMVCGLLLTSYYIARFKLGWIGDASSNTSDNWWFGISPEGFGTVGMLVNFAVALIVCRFTPKPPQAIRELVDRIRIPSGAGDAQRH